MSQKREIGAQQEVLGNRNAAFLHGEMIKLASYLAKIPKFGDIAEVLEDGGGRISASVIRGGHNFWVYCYNTQNEIENDGRFSKELHFHKDGKRISIGVQYYPDYQGSGQNYFIQGSASFREIVSGREEGLCFNREALEKLPLVKKGLIGPLNRLSTVVFDHLHSGGYKAVKA
jgi:hypothetical protein